MSDSFLDAVALRATDCAPEPEEEIDLTDMIAESTEEIDKPDLDKRSYRYLRLSNQMQVMLVSDPECDYAAACMDVNVGSASDPEAIPGLAHFLEHMLFLGTKKYPKEDEYSVYLEQHGGGSNAFTAHENTTYYFSVLQDKLLGAIDRFAQFFLHPLFTESVTKRELKAVDSENSKNLQSDNWRLQQLSKWAADPRHPWSRFNVGNIDTLRDLPSKLVELQLSVGAGGGVGAQIKPSFTPALDLRDALLSFHASHYSANLMSLSVIGKPPPHATLHLATPSTLQPSSLSMPTFSSHPSPLLSPSRPQASKASTSSPSGSCRSSPTCQTTASRGRAGLTRPTRPSASAATSRCCPSRTLIR